MSSPENTSRLGLVDLPTLRDPLTAAGFHLFGGGPFREAAVEIKAAAEQGPVTAILVADRPQPGIKAWLTRMAGLGSIVVILRDDEPRLDVEGARSVDLPTTVGELLATVGAAARSPELAAVRIGLDAQVIPATGPTAPAPEPAPVPPAAPLSVEASPVVFAPQRRVEAAAASPWDDVPAAAPAPATHTAASAAPVATAVAAASPWDLPPNPAYTPDSDSYNSPAIAREEDWFGGPSAPVPSRAAAAPPRMQETAQQPPVAYPGVPAAPSAPAPSQGLSEPRHADPVVEPAPRQPLPYQDNPWGQTQSAPVAVMTPLSKHEIPEAAYTAPTAQHSQPAYAEPTYAEPVYESARSQPVYDPAPAYNDPQAAVDAMFAAAAPPQAFARPQEPRRIRGQGSPLAFICAEKGGVGKSNTTLALAQRAAEQAPGKRVVLVDMNRGQGDIRKYLKLGGAQVPSILDAAISGNIAEAVLSPDQVTAARHSSLPPISFGVVLAPEAEAADPRIVTPEVYQRVIDLVRDQADLVFVDTQIIEIHDTSGLVDGLIVPALAHDAFGVTLTDTSAPGVSNLVSMLGFFAQHGVPRNRLMIVINRALAGYDTNVLRGMLSQYGHFAGAIEEKPALAKAANMGRIPHTDPALAPVLDAALLRITSWPCFSPAPPTAKRKFSFRKAKN